MLDLLKKHSSILIPCFITMFFTGLGQTFLFAQFNPYVIHDLQISRTDLSGIYSLATLLASFNLTYLGGLFDRISTQKFAILTCFFMTLGLFLYGVSTNLFILFLAFYLIRGFGQTTLGLMTTTTISKYFGMHRGKGLTLVGFGRSLSEGVMPPLSIFLIGLYDWRITIGILLVFFIFTMVPLIFKSIPHYPKKNLYPEKEVLNQNENQQGYWSWKIAFQKKWPVFIMLNNAITPFVVTGLFFHQDKIAEAKGWSMNLMANSFIAYSISHILGSLIWGALIDKYSSLRLQRIGLIPLFCALAVLYNFDHGYMAILYMSILGFGLGLTSLIRNTFYAEVYGTQGLGKIKGMDSKVLVIGTALAPFLYAYLLDIGVSAGQLLILLMGITAMGIFNYFLVFLKYQSLISKRPS